MALSVSIDLVSSSARVTSVKFQQGGGVTDGRTSGPKDRTPGLPGSDKKVADCLPSARAVLGHHQRPPVGANKENYSQREI